jgi:hypothetical protein
MNHLPVRGDGVEAWLIKMRDDSGRLDDAYEIINDMLIEYQRLADEGKVMEAAE